LVAGYPAIVLFGEEDAMAVVGIKEWTPETMAVGTGVLLLAVAVVMLRSAWKERKRWNRRYRDSE